MDHCSLTDNVKPMDKSCYLSLTERLSILTQLNVVSLNNVLLNSVQGRKSESTLQSRLSEFDGTKGRSINELLEYSGITPYPR